MVCWHKSDKPWVFLGPLDNLSILQRQSAQKNKPSQNEISQHQNIMSIWEHVRWLATIRRYESDTFNRNIILCTGLKSVKRTSSTYTQHICVLTDGKWDLKSFMGEWKEGWELSRVMALPVESSVALNFRRTRHSVSAFIWKLLKDQFSAS